MLKRVYCDSLRCGAKTLEELKRSEDGSVSRRREKVIRLNEQAEGKKIKRDEERERNEGVKKQGQEGRKRSNKAGRENKTDEI